MPLLGEHQVANLALATLGAEELAASGMDRLDAEAIAAGVAMTRWPGRLEWVEPPANPPVLLDVAHNPDGAQTLGRWLDTMDGRFVLLFGALADKEVDRVLPGLAARAWKVVLTSPASPRALDVEALAAMLPTDKTVLENDRTAALSAALTADGDFVVVCGSVYLVGDVRMDLRRRFGMPYPATDDLQRQ
jgi:dihydrofolate synthase/folylpolyglutamate synthase